LNDNEKNPLLNMQRIMQESRELSEAGATEMGESASEKKVKKERTVNARLKHEQVTKKTTGQKKSSEKDKKSENGTKTSEENKPVEKKQTKKTASKRVKPAESTKEDVVLNDSQVSDTKKNKARYVGPADKNVPSLAEQVSSILMENTHQQILISTVNLSMRDWAWTYLAMIFATC